MKFGNQVDKDTLRTLLAQTPDTPQNAQVRQRLMQIIAAKTVNPVAYTYNAVYWLAGANSALAAGVLNQPFNLNIQADADFLVLNQTFSSNTANAAQTANTLTVPNIVVTLTDTGSGAALMDQAVPVPSIFGTGQFPFVLPQPLLLAAKATLQVSVSNLDAAANYNLRLSFNGVKLFTYN